jgi:hypothetical protein
MQFWVKSKNRSIFSDSKKYRNIPDAADIVYATHSPTSRALNSSGPNLRCLPDEMSCLSSPFECISKVSLKKSILKTSRKNFRIFIGQMV